MRYATYLVINLLVRSLLFDHPVCIGELFSRSSLAELPLSRRPTFCFRGDAYCVIFFFGTAADFFFLFRQGRVFFPVVLVVSLLALPGPLYSCRQESRLFLPPHLRYLDVGRRIPVACACDPGRFRWRPAARSTSAPTEERRLLLFLPPSYLDVVVFVAA
jgi:hypothetical protein